MKRHAGDVYYYVDFENGDHEYVSKDTWYESISPHEFCNRMADIGLVFDTRAEAVEAVRKMLATLD